MSKNAEETRVVIVGAGFAGLRVARRLARARIKVTLIDRNNFHLFQPLLYQVATTGLNPSEISSTVRGNFSRYRNVRVIKAEVTNVDRQAKILYCDDGQVEFPYDYLVLCAGGKTGYFGNDKWSEIAPGLKTLDDAAAIRNRYLENLEKAELCQDKEDIPRLTSVVIIGGGPTGVELAGSFAELRGQVLHKDFRCFEPSQARVILVEGGPSLLHGYHPKLSEYTKKRLEKVGVEVLLNVRVNDITEAGVHAGDLVFASANVIWAAGVEGLPLAKKLAKEVTPRNGIVVKADLTLPDDECVYACGDMAFFTHDERYPKGLPGVAQVAMQQGELTAKNILAHMAGRKRATFHYFDKGKMATIGRSAAVAEAMGIRMRGFIAWCAWLFIHVIYLVEFQDRVLVFLRWIWSYLTWHWGVRIIFAARPLLSRKPQGPTPAGLITVEPTRPANEPDSLANEQPEEALDSATMAPDSGANDSAANEQPAGSDLQKRSAGSSTAETPEVSRPGP
jgi:NADH dehydrogenase